MKLHRISALMVRQLYLMRRSFERITDLLMWPILDVLMLGMTTTWMTRGTTHGQSMMLAILIAIVLFRVVWQSSYEVAINLLEECWNRNLTNLWSSPITKAEWLAANLLIGFFKVAIVVLVVSATIHFLYDADLFVLGFSWIPFMICLIMYGLVLGFIAACIILVMGVRAQPVAWSLCWILAPLSCVYFPLALLPRWLQPISLLLPPTYIFEAMRSKIISGSYDLSLLEISFAINVVLILLSATAFNLVFEWTRSRGFEHLE
jgi:ABC-2 type transport system permease protein